MKAACILFMVLTVLLVGCASRDQLSTKTETSNASGEGSEMRLSIGGTTVPVTWEDNASVEALKAMCPVTIQMSMYGGFEQVGSLGKSIVRNDRQTGFFKKNGYMTVGTLEDCPKGHSMQVLEKRL